MTIHGTPEEAPSFLATILNSAIPLIVAIGIAVVSAFLFYMFWFGIGAAFGWVF